MLVGGGNCLSRGVAFLGSSLPGGGSCLPPTDMFHDDRLIYSCENITFVQLCLRAINCEDPLKVHLYCSESENYYFSLPICLFILQRFLSEANSVLLCLHVLNKALKVKCAIVLTCTRIQASYSLRLYVIFVYYALYFA